MKRSNITKDEILKTINSSIGTPLSLSEKILNEILNIIVDGLNSENIVKIKGFGTFKILNKKSRTGRNPKTGQTHLINARKTVTFYPSKNFKRVINE
tara:strand:+ start:170 stop:460 length:291 start_codon:yes stop_codon:yes gene_type:complete